MFDIVTSDPETREIIRMRESGLRDYVSGINSARREGEARGRMEGRMEGMKEAALNALSMNIPLEQISKLTGLSSAEIASMKPH
jgi:predicted transposase/invertase (TIGR01784 family)